MTRTQKNANGTAMNVEKVQESYIYDVEVENKHYSVTLQTDCNIGYTNLTITDAEGSEVKSGSRVYRQVIAALDNYFEFDNKEGRKEKNMININWPKVLQAAEVVLRTIRKILLGR